jgi:pimeloyl-ACP methyl ester carboxylesterase
LLAVVDTVTREALAIEVDTSLPGERVVRVLERLAAEWGVPRAIVRDDGPELTGRPLDQWAYGRGVQPRVIAPGKPIQNAFAERFVGRLRDECRNAHWFTRLADARRMVEAWRRDSNAVRPRSALGYRTPIEARRTHATAAATPPLPAGLSRWFDRGPGAGHWGTPAGTSVSQSTSRWSRAAPNRLSTASDGRKGPSGSVSFSAPVLTAASRRRRPRPAARRPPTAGPGRGAAPNGATGRHRAAASWPRPGGTPRAAPLHRPRPYTGRAADQVRREPAMPTVHANGIGMNYETQGDGEPLVLIPFLSADQACYAFQVAEYAKHFRCVTVDPRGAGLTDKPAGTYTTELFADDVAALMTALGLGPAHVAGLSLGGATGLWLAGKYPHLVKTLSVHSAWTKTDPFIRTAVEGWRVMARGLGSVAETVITGIFPWCFTPDFYSANGDYIRSLTDFVRGRPAQPVEAFLRQSDAVLTHDAESQLARIAAPTLVTFGRFDLVTSTRFADALTGGIGSAELHVFEDCSHTPIYQNPEAFNQRTLAFLSKHAG